MAKRVRDLARQCLTDGRKAILVGVKAARGSTPRDPGAFMLVHEEGCAGSIGGGELEYQAILSARAQLRAGDFSSRSETFILGPDLGQCCGGAVEIEWSPLSPVNLAAWAAPSSPPLYGSLYLYGAGHVANALMAILGDLPFALHWLESRPDFCVAAGEGSTPPSLIADPPAFAETCKPGGQHIVMTHSHDLDYAIVRALLRRDDFAYLGLIGSQTKSRRFRARLGEEGVAEAAIARLRCPIGLSGIAAKEPAAIAIAIAAQLLRRQGAIGKERVQSPAKSLKTGATAGESGREGS